MQTPLEPVCSWGPSTLWEKGEHGNIGGIQATCGDTVFQTKLTDKCTVGDSEIVLYLKLRLPRKI